MALSRHCMKNSDQKRPSVSGRRQYLYMIALSAGKFFGSLMITGLFTMWGMFPVIGYAEPVKGIYGVPAVSQTDPKNYIHYMQDAGINAVFIPDDAGTIKWFKSRGYKAFISLNVFGGKQAWEAYPDARPVKSDGTFLGEEKDYRGYGGVCPSHAAWRRERLNRIEAIVNRSADDIPDGLWLDFIRYPGFWETPRPYIQDTCYCPRCVNGFLDFMKIQGKKFENARQAADWIKSNHPYEWMIWKKNLIDSFVKDAREILNRLPEGRRPLLGLFIVPWTRGERGNAIHRYLAQDAFALSRHADIISPMVYHKMCNRPSSWVGFMTRYYKETACSQVWPIVQSKDCDPETFQKSIQSAGKADADGILIYSFKGMTSDAWAAVKDFQQPVNLIPNSQFDRANGECPRGWMHGLNDIGCEKGSRFSVKPSNQFYLKEDDICDKQEPSNCIGVTAGHDGAGFWYAQLPPCRVGETYVFTADLYRELTENGVFPAIRLWGERFSMNTHWKSKRWQAIRLFYDCDDVPSDHGIYFMNSHPGRTFWMTQPKLVNHETFESGLKKLESADHFFPDFFPIGVYGVGIDDFETVKEMGLNTVVIGGSGKTLKSAVDKCRQLGLKTVISIPRDPDQMTVLLDELGEYIRPSETAFYVNDEPGIHSFPMNTASDIQRLIKEKLNGVATCAAIVRPLAVRDYEKSMDFFMLDQYPVPFMPMTWLSDSMDKAGAIAGKDRLASVIQAFGGQRWEKIGWPRIPTWQEMDCLTFLSIIHGSRGIFFYTYSVIGKTEQGRHQLRRVTTRLNRIYPWLLKKTSDRSVKVEMISSHRSDELGRTPVHVTLKQSGKNYMLIAVNTIRTYVESKISINGLNIRDPKEFFPSDNYRTQAGSMFIELSPYETAVFTFRE